MEARHFEAKTVISKKGQEVKRKRKKTNLLREIIGPVNSLTKQTPITSMQL